MTTIKIFDKNTITIIILFLTCPMVILTSIYQYRLYSGLKYKTLRKIQTYISNRFINNTDLGFELFLPKLIFTNNSIYF